MIRKIKRSSAYDISVQIRDDEFIRPPRDLQRNWLLNRSIKEFADDLENLHRIAPQFVPGDEPAELNDRTNIVLDDEQIMEDWQITVMKAMVGSIARSLSENSDRREGVPDGGLFFDHLRRIAGSI